MISLLRRLVLRLRSLVSSAERDRDLAREIRSHLRLLADDFERQGMSKPDARDAARRAFGGVEQAKERARDERSIQTLEDVKRDVRLAVRSLRRAPGFSLVSIVTLGLGVGGATAIYSVLYGVVLEPLPFSEAEQLVAVHHSMPGVGHAETPLSRAMYLTYREHAKTLVDIGLWKRRSVTVTGLAEPERVEGVRLTDGTLALLGVRPILGRGYHAADVSPGGEGPVLLGYGYWQRRFGGSLDVLERTIRVNGTERPIIGVLPKGVWLDGVDPALCLPLVIDAEAVRVGAWSFEGVARARSGFTFDTISRELTGLTRLATEEYPGIPIEELESRDFSTFVRPLKSDIVGEAANTLWIVFGAVTIVLGIACTNVANLFLLKAEVNQRQASLQAVMGASKGRLARQFLAEGLLVGILGASLGLLVTSAGIRLFLSLAPETLPRAANVAFDENAIAFSIGVSLMAGLVFGLMTTFRVRRQKLTDVVNQSSRAKVGASRQQLGLRNALAVLQISLALVLLVALGLMLRTYHSLSLVPPGFESPHEVVTFRVSLPPTELRSGEETARMHHEVVERIRSVPGVTAVSAATSVAMDSWDSWEDVHVEDFPELDDRARPYRRMNWVSPGYFDTLRNPLLAGRDFTWTDLYERRPVAVVTENFAREFWQEPRRAIGKRIRTNPEYPWSEIIGVVGNVHTRGVATTAPSIIYFPFFMGQFWADDFVWRDLRYAVRTVRRDTKRILPKLREAVRSVSPDSPLYRILTLDEIQAQSQSMTSFTLVMLTIAAGMALFLGLVGVYGVLSYIVTQRTREVGLRLALGARPADVRRFLLNYGGALAAAGIVLGLPAIWVLSRFFSSLLFGVRAFDPATYAAIATLLGGIVMCASWIPARRAARVDPSIALRCE